MTPIIETHNLARWYGPVIGVTDVSIAIPRGVVGLLGPNGAGKSTLLKLVTGQVRPSAGTVRVLGRDPSADALLFRDVGYCSEDDALFEDLDVARMVRFLARLHGYRGPEGADRAARALAVAGAAELATKRCRELSKGQRQRVRIASAILHDPDVLLLDEPMTGLDPLGRRAVIDLIRGLAARGKAVVFSSHILHEVEAVATHVVVLNKGMVLAEGTLPEIREALSDYAFTVEIRGSDLRRLAERLITRAHVTSVSVGEDGALRVASESARLLSAELPCLVLDLGIEVESLTTPDESLEALFSRLVARRPA